MSLFGVLKYLAYFRWQVQNLEVNKMNFSNALPLVPPSIWPSCWFYIVFFYRLFSLLHFVANAC